METTKAARKPSVFLFLAATSALLGAIAMGTVLGWSSPAVRDMEERSDSSPKYGSGQTDSTEKSWVGSSATLGALFGALASGPIAQILGRKFALILYGIPMVAGFGCLWLAGNLGTIIVGRVLTGLSAGLISGTAPTYVVEISTEKIRGLLGAGFQLCVTIGILSVYVFGSFLTWNWLSAICIVPALFMSILMLCMPETPIWLMTKSGGDHSKGSKVEKSLRVLRHPSNDNESELNEIAEQAEAANRTKSFSVAESQNPLFYKPFILSVLLMFFQQFSGINAVMFNAEIILKEAGSAMKPAHGAIIIAVAQVITTVIASLLVDRLGRKKLLIVSGAGHAVSLGLLGVYYMFSLDAKWLPVVCLVVFIISFSLGWGPIPWLMIAEITPMAYRSMVSAVATGVNWSCAFLITLFFRGLQEATSKQFAFFLFAFFCILSIPFVVCFLPETKGKTFEEILRFFTKDKIVGDQSTPSASNAMLKADNKGNVAGLNGSDNRIEMKGFNESNQN